MSDRDKKLDEKRTDSKQEIASDEVASDEDKRRLRFPNLFGLKTKYIIGLVAANVVVVGVIVALLMMRGEETAVVDKPESTRVIDPLHVVVKADMLLLAGKPSEAIAQYKRVSKANTSHATAVAYRLAVGMEAMGDLTESLRYYEIANSNDLSETSLAAQIGAARVHCKLKQFDAALYSLQPLSSVSALPVFSSTELGAQVRYMMAFALSSKVQANQPRSLIDTEHIFRESILLSTKDALKLVPMDSHQIRVPIPVGDDTRIGIRIYGQPREPNTTLLSCGLQNQAAVVLLELLARETGWKISLSPIASEVLSAKRIEIQRRDVTAGELLSSVLEPQGLFWAYQGDTLVVDRIEQFPRELVDERRLSRATTLLLGALAESPSHDLAPHAYLALGNLATMNGRYDQAETFYKDTRQRFPRHTAAQLANMNLAKVALRNGKPRQAEELLYDVVDARGQKTLAPLALLFLGRLHLEAEDSEKAKRELSRCLAVAKQPELAATAAMTLAAVYLLRRDDSSARIANSVLMENRDALQDPRWIDNSVFLSALTRFRVATRPMDLQRRGRELVESTARVQPEKFFGAHGYLLVGDAFSELSIGVEATRLYHNGLQQKLPAAMRDILMYRLAMEYKNQNDVDSAKSTLSELFTSESSRLTVIAAIDLGKLLLQEGSLQECVQHCRTALAQDLSDDSIGQLLKTLGQAYEELGNHSHASLCFGGFLPNSIATQTVQPTR